MITVESGPVSFVAVSPDSKTLVSGNYFDKTIRLWNAKTGKEKRKLELKDHAVGSLFFGVWSVAFSPDGKTLASGSGDETIKLWDVKK